MTDDPTEMTPETPVSDSSTPASSFQEPETPIIAPEVPASVVDMPQGEDQNQAPIQSEPEIQEEGGGARRLGIWI